MTKTLEMIFGGAFLLLFTFCLQPSHSIHIGCTGVECPFYGQCVLDANNRTTCVCPDVCPLLYHPVCGSDNQTYNNPCELQRESCQTNTTITVLRDGSCEGSSTPCDGETCPTGKSCSVDGNNLPRCECDDLCNLKYAPVCGNNSKTYSNLCLLKVDACKEDIEIKVINSGRCKNASAGCDGITCPTGRICSIDANSNSICVCDERCTRENAPVCGSNGLTYNNLCLLKVDACKKCIVITVLHNGECNNVCSGVRCAYGHCVPDSDNRPRCVCSIACPEIYLPVCGSDNTTYANECEMRRISCETNATITVLYHGTCEGGHACNGSICKPGRYCELNAKGQPKCVCITVCPAIYAPVCGCDGKTYGNKCLLLSKACTTNTVITLRHNGSCDEGCTGVKCPFYGHCVPDATNRTTCVCPDVCPLLYRPVCGSDNQTYNNLCELKRESCETNTTIPVLRDGSCEGGCEAVQCEAGRSCEVNNSTGLAECVCNKMCMMIYKPVCGSDGKTYGNWCELKVAACLTNCDNLTKDYDGQCKTDCSQVACPRGKSCVNSTGHPRCVCDTMCPMILDPVCGSDGKNYSNECLLNVTACLTDTNITMVHKGECGTGCSGLKCPDGQVCKVNSEGDPECVCNKNCPTKYDPVCGSNRKTYSNKCFLLAAACEDVSRNITMIHKGEC